MEHTTVDGSKFPGISGRVASYSSRADTIAIKLPCQELVIVWVACLSINWIPYCCKYVSKYIFCTDPFHVQMQLCKVEKSIPQNRIIYKLDWISHLMYSNLFYSNQAKVLFECHKMRRCLISTGPMLMQHTTDNIYRYSICLLLRALTYLYFATIYLDFPEPKPLVSGLQVNGHMASLYRPWYAGHLAQNNTTLCVFCQ